MQKGVNLWDAAGFLGMTVQQLEQGYGHHHPDYQEQAVAALGGQYGARNPVNKRRRTVPNVTKIDDISKGGYETPRSGRGGRRFKSCHSDQYLADFLGASPTDSPTEIQLGWRLLGQAEPDAAARLHSVDVIKSPGSPYELSSPARSGHSLGSSTTASSRILRAPQCGLSRLRSTISRSTGSGSWLA